jgi:hypothetical protein
MKSEIHGIELIAKMVGQNDVGDKSSLSPTLHNTVLVEYNIEHYKHYNMDKNNKIQTNEITTTCLFSDMLA